VQNVLWEDYCWPERIATSLLIRPATEVHDALGKLRESTRISATTKRAEQRPQLRQAVLAVDSVSTDVYRYLQALKS
jgi:glucose-6-phosphate-specific signal transduction histidine kinase